MKSKTSIRPFPQAMSTPGLGLFKWTRSVPVPGKQYPRIEVHPSGSFAGLASEARKEAIRRGIDTKDGWEMVRA